MNRALYQAELTAPNLIYFTPKNQLCKDRPLTSSKFRTDTRSLLQGYQLCAATEGKNPATIAIVEASVRYLEEFFCTNSFSAEIERIGVWELRHFIVCLQGRQRFAQHRFTKPQQGHLPGHTVNGYLRALRALWAWA